MWENDEEEVGGLIKRLEEKWKLTTESSTKNQLRRLGPKSRGNLQKSSSEKQRST